MTTATGPRPGGLVITDTNDPVGRFTAHTTVAGGRTLAAGFSFARGREPRSTKNTIPATATAAARIKAIALRRTDRRFRAASFLASHRARISGGGQSLSGGRS